MTECLVVDHQSLIFFSIVEYLKDYILLSSEQLTLLVRSEDENRQLALEEKMSGMNITLKPYLRE